MNSLALCLCLKIGSLAHKDTDGQVELLSVVSLAVDETVVAAAPLARPPVEDSLPGIGLMEVRFDPFDALLDQDGPCVACSWARLGGRSVGAGWPAAQRLGVLSWGSRLKLDGQDAPAP